MVWIHISVISLNGVVWLSPANPRSSDLESEVAFAALRFALWWTLGFVFCGCPCYWVGFDAAWTIALGSKGLLQGDERATRRWLEVQHREGSRSRSRGCSGRRREERVVEARGRRRVREIKTLNKPYGFGSSKNRSHIPLFGTGSCWTEAKHQKCSPFLASGLVGPRSIALFGIAFARTEAYSCLWLRVLAESRHKTWLKLQKCHCAIICFSSWPTETYKAR